MEYDNNIGQENSCVFSWYFQESLTMIAQTNWWVFNLEQPQIRRLHAAQTRRDRGLHSWGASCWILQPGSHVSVVEEVMFIVNLYWLYIRSYLGYLVHLARYARVDTWSILWAENRGDIRTRVSTHINHTTQPSRRSLSSVFHWCICASPGIIVIKRFEVLSVCRQHLCLAGIS